MPREHVIGPKSWNDDTAINGWVTHYGPGETWHPLPTIIEHDSDGALPSTVGHGDEFSRERISWRRYRDRATKQLVTHEWDVRAMTAPRAANCSTTG